MTQGTVGDTVRTSSPAVSRTARLRRLAGAARPLLFVMVAAMAVGLAGRADYQHDNPVFEYGLRAGVVALVVAGATVWWWTARQGGTWGFDLAPALLGAIGGAALAGSLNGTPYPPGGLDGDQSFRTAAITRFADSWHNADFTFQGLPSFYAPAYFWVLGRAADLAGIEAWRMTKYGTVLAAVLVPTVAYLLWRRLVPAPVAVLLSTVPLVVENFYEPYAWLVLVAIVPWWLNVVYGGRITGSRPGHPVALGLLGGLLFLTYYYFFFILALALVAHVALERSWPQLRRAVVVLAVAAATSAVYWLPLLVSILRAEHARSLANRWFSSDHPLLPLPMLEPSVTGVVALAGLVYLVWTVWRELLSRGLLVLLAAAYGWYLLGAPAAAAGAPLLSFRGEPLIPLVLLTAGVLAAVRIVRWAAGRYAATDVRRVAWVLGVVLVVAAGQALVTTIRDSPLVGDAHVAAAQPPDPTPAQLQRAIDARPAGDGHPVLLSDRVDLLVRYPNYGFLQWNAHYAHPASEFPERVRFLRDLAAVRDPDVFAARSAGNRFDRIDGFVLSDGGDTLGFSFTDDNFPAGTRRVTIRFPRELFSADHFHLVPAGDHVLAIRRL